MHKCFPSFVQFYVIEASARFVPLFSISHRKFKQRLCMVKNFIEAFISRDMSSTCRIFDIKRVNILYESFIFIDHYQLQTLQNVTLFIFFLAPLFGILVDG